MVANFNCIHTFTSAKLVITTSSRLAAGQGPVLVETQSGGVGISGLTFTFTSEEVFQPPEVTGISPHEGALSGGERIILRGNYLGESKSDVVMVSIAGVNCTQTLEYFSRGE